MAKGLTLGSLFDGSGGFPLAGLLSGIRPVWASEIEPFPIRVTTKRLPDMKHYGDVSKISGADIEPVDIITFGSPCQDLSVAGKREGIEQGQRSSLFFEAIRIIKEMRGATNGRNPTFIVWENVPGALSSGGGQDFRRVLEEVCGLKEADVSIPRPAKWSNAGEIVGDGFSVAWRMLDAQYWGVAQRRKRIYLVGDFAGERAGKILFESEGVSRYSAESFRAWQTATRNTAENVGTTGGLYYNHGQRADWHGPVEVAQTVSHTFGSGGNNTPFVVDTPITLKIRQGCEGGGEPMVAQAWDGSQISPTLTSSNAGGSQRMPDKDNFNCVVALEGNGSRPSHRGAGYSEDDVSYTLNSVEHHGVAYGIDRAAFNIGKNGKFGIQINEECEPSMTARGLGAVGQPIYTTSHNSFHVHPMVNVAAALEASEYRDPPTVAEPPYYIVRRLTPTECARLQGFPDWWCADLDTPDPTEDDIAFWADVFETHRKVVNPDGKPKTRKQIVKWLQHPHTDSAEYKMWGNGVALPNVYYVMCGIASIINEEV